MPNRIIKESICRSDSIDSLSWFEEVLFYRLIVVCDDYGRFDGRPSVIRGSCFPLKDIRLEQIENALKRLSTAGMVRMYKAEERPFLQLTTWEQHQRIRAKKSKFPAPDETCCQMTADVSRCGHMKESADKCSRNPIQSESNPNPNPKENAREAGGVRLFEDFLFAYPKDCNRYLTEHEYALLLETGKIMEGDLVQCAKNYAEACRMQETPERYIKNAENFLKEFVFEKYLPGTYRRPEGRKKAKNAFCNFNQREVDYDGMVLEEMKRMRERHRKQGG